MKTLFIQLIGFFRKYYSKIIIIALGAASLIWFIIRVVPKPSRAAYPCQRAAFPMASSFMIWLSGLLVSSLVYVKARRLWRKSRYILASALFIAAMLIFTTGFLRNNDIMLFANRVNYSITGDPLPKIINTLQDTSVIQPASYIGVVKSEKANAIDIDQEEIEDMVAEAVERAGGFGALISDGDTVVLKPNLISFLEFSAARDTLTPEVNGVATDYRVIQAVTNLVRQYNPNGKIYLIEGSGVGSTTVNMSILKWDEVTGLDGIYALEDLNPVWFDTTDVNLIGVSLPEDKCLYNTVNNRYWLNKLYYEADVLISLPVLKNHLATGSTGALLPSLHLQKQL